MTTIHFVSNRQRATPRQGDRKTVRGITYVRVWSRITSGPDRGCLVVSRGKPVYEWERENKDVKP